MIHVTMAQDKKVHAALGVGIDLEWEEAPRLEDGPAQRQIHRLTIPRDSVDARDWFDTAAAQFEQWVAEDSVTVLHAGVSVKQLDPLTPEGRHGEALLAMLILAFPEVRWLFATAWGDEKGNKQQGEVVGWFLRNHGLSGLFTAVGPPLFDGSGLRNFVRQNMFKLGEQEAQAKQRKKNKLSYLPMRCDSAVAMDEETDYAYLHAWAAYRFGFRAQVVSRFDQAKAIFGNAVNPEAGDAEGKQADEGCNGTRKEESNDELPSLVFEDIYLNLPDDSKGGLSLLAERDKPFPRLCDVPVRVLVTSGHDKDLKDENCEYIEKTRKSEGKRIGYLYKPHAGIFSLWKKTESALREEESSLWKKEKSFLRKALSVFSINGRLEGGRFPCYMSGDDEWPGTAQGFVWPPKWEENPPESQKGFGHSSPGVLVVVARHLLNRAERMLNDGIATVEEAVRGAVLASDALELLGGKTPTMSTEALAIKHQFELHAECQFLGVEHHLDMSGRLKEIEGDAKAIAGWFQPTARKKAELNIRLDVVNKLVCILREYNQFDEERGCMVKARSLHCALYLRQKPGRWVSWPALWYSGFLLSSPLCFFGAIAFWFTSFWLAYSCMIGLESASTDPSSAFDHAVSTFFGVDNVTNLSAFSAIVILVGLFHLGVFISLIYDLLNRR